MLKKNIDEIKQKILPILKEYGAKKVALFGSCVRDEMGKESDIDILVDIKADISLLGFVGLKQKKELRSMDSWDDRSEDKLFQWMLESDESTLHYRSLTRIKKYFK